MNKTDRRIHMNKTLTFIFCAALLTAGALFPSGDPGGEKLFPDLENFSKAGKIEVYTPDTLFEYINGGADLFLNYDFVKLYSLKYTGENSAEITADIYVHDGLPNGFGIYTQERPEEGNFLGTGTEGYYEPGTLNFFKGSYYVKLSSFDLGEKDKIILTRLASGISENIMDKPGYPEIFTAFESENSIPGSDKYTNIDYLGHSFLAAAYSRQYRIGGKVFTLFVIQGASPEEVRNTFEAYTGFAKGKGSVINGNDHTVSFADPYYSHEGKMNLRISGNLMAGMFCNDISVFIRLSDPILK
jgi:hypothetical protein